MFAGISKEALRHLFWGDLEDSKHPLSRLPLRFYQEILSCSQRTSLKLVIFRNVSPPTHIEDRCVGLQLSRFRRARGHRSATRPPVSGLSFIKCKWLFCEWSQQCAQNLRKTLKWKWLKQFPLKCHFTSFHWHSKLCCLFSFISLHEGDDLVSWESSACFTHLAVISLLNCSLIGPLQRLITLTSG